ncbi:MAG: hypothetical protein NTY80_02770 [candidate division SR1 bacterium]|nr:hypothetical protein [candidate division SR1 bacterium]
MKKLLLFSCMIIGMITATFGQTGIHITVYPQLFAGSLSGGISPLCYNNSPGLMTGTVPVGGQGAYSYQWQKSTDGGLTWTNIIGANGVNLNPGNLTMSTDFRRNDADPCGTVTTNTISILVYGQFVAGVTTGGNTPLCYNGNGGILTSTLETGGAPGTTYQWEQSIDGGLTWTIIAGATTTSYAIGTLTQTTEFRIGFNNACGTIYGNTTTITVYAIFVQGVVTGGNSNICNNANGGILTSTAPTGGAPGTTLQWESSTDGITYTSITGATTLTYVVGNLTQTMWYRLVYTNTCGVITSNVTNLVVYPIFVQGSIVAVGGTTVCNNTDFGSFVGNPATGGAPSTTYQWEQSINGGVTWTIIAGATGVSYDPAALSVTTMFHRQDVNTCGAAYTNAITITVYPPFSTGVIGVNQAICYGSTPNQLNFITPPSGGDGTYTYMWESSFNGLNPWTSIAGATGTTYQPPSLTSGIWFHVIVTSGSGCGSGPALP